MSCRETEHLRVLVANERKARLALVAPIVVAQGHEVVAPAWTLRRFGSTTPSLVAPCSLSKHHRSWFSRLKARCIWLHEFEALDHAREVIATRIDGYHHRPHNRPNYRKPGEVAQT